MRRPRVRGKAGQEIPLPGWTAAQQEDWLGKRAMNLVLIKVSTRKFGRAVRLSEGDLPVEKSDGTLKSAASRHFVALSAVKMREWMNSKWPSPNSRPICEKPPRETMTSYGKPQATYATCSRPKNAGTSSKNKTMLQINCPTL